MVAINLSARGAYPTAATAPISATERHFRTAELKLSVSSFASTVKEWAISRRLSKGTEAADDFIIVTLFRGRDKEEIDVFNPDAESAKKHQNANILCTIMFF
jgi:hypothetical protein